MQHVFFLYLCGSSNEGMIAWKIFDFDSSDHEILRCVRGMCSRELLFFFGEGEKAMAINM